MRLLAAALIAFACAAPAAGQERAPAERQSLLELAYALGESHALRQSCEGPDDQYWRQRMLRLAEVEAADQGFDAQLRDRFNTGFAAGQGRHPGCNRETRRAQGVVAARGRALAAQLAQVMRGANRIVLPEVAPE